jgi:hypothetical protein
MNDLATWLPERFDEDEREAHRLDHMPPCASWADEECDCLLGERKCRALREVEAKRRILALHVRVVLHKGAGADYYITATVCMTCGGSDSVFSDGTLAPGRAARYPCPTLKVLALPHADREGYQNEWRPADKKPAEVPAPPSPHPFNPGFGPGDPLNHLCTRDSGSQKCGQPYDAEVHRGLPWARG